MANLQACKNSRSWSNSMGLFIGLFTLFSFGVQFFKHKVQFRHILPQLGVPQLLEDKVGKDSNECCKCRSVTNCKLISFCELDIVGALQSIWSSSEQMSRPAHLDTSSCRPHHWPRVTRKRSQFPLILLFDAFVNIHNCMDMYTHAWEQ